MRFVYFDFVCESMARLVTFAFILSGLLLAEGLDGDERKNCITTEHGLFVLCCVAFKLLAS